MTLFNDKNRHKFENTLNMIKKGCTSDLPGMLMYIPKTDNYGRPVVEKDGLALYRLVRGTSNLERLHQ